jgi:hypothetical protein
MRRLSLSLAFRFLFCSRWRLAKVVGLLLLAIAGTPSLEGRADKEPATTTCMIGVWLLGGYPTLRLRLCAFVPLQEITYPVMKDRW